MNEELSPEEIAAVRTWSNVGAPGAAPEGRYRPTSDQIRRHFSAIVRPQEIEFELPLTERDLAALRRGHHAEEMEDKWNIYCDESDVVHFHRSWTGCEIFRFELEAEPGRGGALARNLLVEADESIYTPADMQEAVESLLEVLEWVFGVAL